MAAHYKDYANIIKQSLDLREVVARYGLEPNRQGYVCCPFRGERTPSMKVWKDHYKCFGCGAYGDVISFVQEYENIEFIDALKTLNRDFGLGLSIESESVPLKQLRARQKMQHKIAENRKALHFDEIYENYENDLILAWATYDSIILDNPVPDNKKTAHAYMMRDYIGYLFDSADGEGNDELQLARHHAD